MKLRVYYEDTDTGGVVYHSNYLNFCERARSEAFFSWGLSPFLEGGHFVARKIEAQYFASAKLGDMLEIKTVLHEMRAFFTLIHHIYKDEKKIFEMQILLAYISFEGKPQKIDDANRALLLGLFE